MILEATHTFKIQDSNMFCKQCCPPAVQFKRCYEDNKVDKFYVYNAVPQFSFLSVAAGIFFSLLCLVRLLFFSSFSPFSALLNNAVIKLAYLRLHFHLLLESVKRNQSKLCF